MGEGKRLQVKEQGCWKQHYHVPAADVSEVDDDVHLRRPQLDLPLPGRDGGERHHQQEGSVELVLVEQVVEEADCLDGLPQTHLVCQDAAVPPDRTGSVAGRCLWTPQRDEGTYLLHE